MRLRRDKRMIVLQPSATRHKFRLCTGFATGRPPEHPPGRPLRYRIQAMGKKADKDYKKYKAPDGAISRAEGHSRRCRYYESVAVQRHLSPRRSVTGGPLGPNINGSLKILDLIQKRLEND